MFDVLQLGRFCSNITQWANYHAYAVHVTYYQRPLDDEYKVNYKPLPRATLQYIW